MKLSCLIRPLIDTKFSHFIFIPILHNIMHNSNTTKWLIVLILLMWIWSWSFTCNDDDNGNFIRAAEGVLRDVVLQLVALLLIERFTNIGCNSKMITAAALSYFMQYFVGGYLTFLSPIATAMIFTNPLMYLKFL